MTLPPDFVFRLANGVALLPTIGNRVNLAVSTRF